MLVHPHIRTAWCTLSSHCRHQHSHSHSRTNDSTRTRVLSWGLGCYGGLGNGSLISDHPVFTPITSLSHPHPTHSHTHNTNDNDSASGSGYGRVTSIASGWTHNLAVTDTGRVYHWGHRENIRLLGLTSKLHRMAPNILRRLQALDMGMLTLSNATTVPTPLAVTSVSDCVSGGDFNALLTSTGAVYSWGANFYGQLGHSKNKPVLPTPTIIDGLSLFKIVVTKISAGYGHLAILTSDGELLVCGKHHSSQLGLTGDNAFSMNQKQFKGVFYPTPVLETCHPTQCFLPLSFDLKSPMISQRVNQLRLPLRYIGPVVDVSCGMKHTLLVNSVGRVFATGSNSFGQCGTAVAGDNDSASDSPLMSFQPLESLSHETIVAVSAGTNHSLFLTADGRVYACGLNDQGQCGLPKAQSTIKYNKKNQNASFHCIFIPTEIPLPNTFTVRKIFAGFYDSALVSDSGRCLWMGGELKQSQFTAPHVLSHLNYNDTVKVRHVSFGLGHALALVDEGGPRSHSGGSASVKVNVSGRGSDNGLTGRPSWY